MNNTIHRSTDKEMASRVSEALNLLLEGYSPASIIKTMSKTHNVSIRQARRYVSGAQLDYFMEPMTRNDLEFGIALHIERLDRIADIAHQEKETKLEIAAVKASSGLRENRLKALQREQEYMVKTGSKGTIY
jgi:hypothetical protein